MRKPQVACDIQLRRISKTFFQSNIPVVRHKGGGGSFKDRKPIGEVGCCESWMAERIHWWTERGLEQCFWNNFWRSGSKKVAVPEHLFRLGCGFAWQAQGDSAHFCTFPREKNMRVCSSFKNVGRCGTFEEDACRVAGAVQETCFSEMLGGLGADGCILVHQIFKFDKMIFRDTYNTSYDLASLFSWQAQYFRQTERKNRKMHWHEAVSSAVNFLFSKEVLQICFVLIFDVVNLLRKSCRIPSFLTLSSSNIEDWGNLAELLRF